MKAKKHLGQHFLKSERALRAIIDAGNIHPDDLVLEIGPGTGILTNKLIPLAKKVIAIEKDRELVEHLRETFRDAIEEHRLDVTEHDILTWDPELFRFYGKSYKLIANIPYYITGAIIEQFLSTSFQPEQMVLLIQKEVAERIVARDGKESVLSIAVKTYGTPRIVEKVPRGAFAPAPAVDSAIISIENISRAFFKNCDEKTFFSVLKALFGKKRKQIGGSLAEYLDNKTRALDILSTLTLDPKTRPEDLSLEDWKHITIQITKSAVQ